MQNIWKKSSIELYFPANILQGSLSGQKNIPSINNLESKVLNFKMDRHEIKRYLNMHVCKAFLTTENNLLF